MVVGGQGVSPGPPPTSFHLPDAQDAPLDVPLRPRSGLPRRPAMTGGIAKFRGLKVCIYGEIGKKRITAFWLFWPFVSVPYPFAPLTSRTDGHIELPSFAPSPGPNARADFSHFAFIRYESFFAFFATTKKANGRPRRGPDGHSRAPQATLGRPGEPRPAPRPAQLLCPKRRPVSAPRLGRRTTRRGLRNAQPGRGTMPPRPQAASDARGATSGTGGRSFGPFG